MSQFYARYVPPAAAQRNEVQTAASPVTKRKRTTEEKDPYERKRKKSQKAHKGDGDTKVTRNTNGDIDVKETSEEVLKSADQTDGERVGSPQPGRDVGINTRKKKEKRKHKQQQEETRQVEPSSENAEPGEDDEYSRKHGSVLSKFNKARSERRPEAVVDEHVYEAEEEQLHGLEPIPQPEVVHLPKQRPTYSTLAPWQADAVRVVNRQTKAFKDLRISQTTIDNLKKSGIEKSFPIQTTVLPLLLEGDQKHTGDVCVSAATGSGKTLAYVVPIIEDLKDHANTQLRAVIVVPTRELVQQVRQLCEICAAGTKLKVAAASGNKALKDEQEMLVSEEEVYDPERWEQEQKAPMDWSKFSISSFLQEAQRQAQWTSVHFVKQSFSKVDILITTPGRLVDHLRSTPGFNLDHVKWLAVDEADRLLNESYQEWIDTVMPALQSQAATAQRDELLRSMRMQPPKRKVQKVLLSATMTNDISKLASLGLDNPKLVILGQSQADKPGNHAEDMDLPEQQGDFNLPQTLVEYAVPIKDGYEKPLYLLELLRQRILPKAGVSDTKINGTNASSDSSSDSDSSSESESGSGSDSDSDSVSSLSSSSSDSSSASSPTAKSAKKASKALFDQHKPSRTNSINVVRALIFTRSTSAATRLSRLLTLLSPTLTSQISTLTKSTSSSSASRRALSAFRSGKTTILIATDRASRGLDIPDLQHVISYNVPSSALTYVHRVGRTARAGKEGTAWTILEHREGKWFWGEIGGKGQGGNGDGEGAIVRGRGVKVQKVNNLEVDVEGWKERYDEALGRLGEEVKGS